MRRLLLTLSFLFSASITIGAPLFTLSDPGKEAVVDYEKYGKFISIGTADYKYKILNSQGLKSAVGEGIYPNTMSLLKDPQYMKFLSEKKLEGSHWGFVNTDDCQANFYKWASCSEEPGVKQYYTALALEKAGLIQQAIKAYYNVVVCYPKSTGMTYWKSPWYIGPVAIDKINFLTRENPGLGIKLVGASIKVKNKFDDNLRNDVFSINPGKIVKAKSNDFVQKQADFSKQQTVKTIGTGSIKLLKYDNNHWQMTVDNKPYVVHGMAYSPNKVGLSPDNKTLDVSRDWMFADFNKNGIIDSPYEAWIDANRNNIQDPDEKAVGDFQIMKDMGVNTLRLYHHADFNKKLLMDGYKKYGFMYMMGDFIGMYATASKAEWFKGTDYTNKEQCKNMLESVRTMVEQYKDEPYILMWVLGNENNYGTPGKAGVSAGTGCRAKLQPEAYYDFVNEAAKLIKSLDPLHRPVAVCSGDVLYLDICAAHAPEIDIFGANAYRGKEGFGALWQDVSDVFDRPVIITEYGCSAYHHLWNQQRAEDGQEEYHRGNWMDIENNTAGHGVGNALGGVAFEWVDEWWKAGPPPEFDPSKQDTTSQFGAPFLDGYSYEEWLGICSQGNGTNSPLMRQLRPTYFTYKKLWNK